jgi:hypothetical protein
MYDVPPYFKAVDGPGAKVFGPRGARIEAAQVWDVEPSPIIGSKKESREWLNRATGS